MYREQHFAAAEQWLAHVNSLTPSELTPETMALAAIAHALLLPVARPEAKPRPEPRPMQSN